MQVDLAAMDRLAAQYPLASQPCPRDGVIQKALPDQTYVYAWGYALYWALLSGVHSKKNYISLQEEVTC